MPAPQFKGTAVVDGAFKEISLDDYKGKWVILFFYPLYVFDLIANRINYLLWLSDFTFVCPTEIIAFSDRAEEFRKINAEIIGVSVDSHFTHLAWINTPRKEGGLGQINIPLLSDLNHNIGENYGSFYLDSGHHLRSTFIIDPNQKIRHISMNEPPVGRSVDEVLRLLEGFQSFEEIGEVCPANWKSKIILPFFKSNQY